MFVCYSSRPPVIRPAAHRGRAAPGTAGRPASFLGKERAVSIDLVLCALYGELAGLVRQAAYAFRAASPARSEVVSCLVRMGDGVLAGYLMIGTYGQRALRPRLTADGVPRSVATATASIAACHSAADLCGDSLTGWPAVMDDQCSAEVKTAQAGILACIGANIRARRAVLCGSDSLPTRPAQACLNRCESAFCS
jgi:hypothetical protein